MKIIYSVNFILLIGLLGCSTSSHKVALPNENRASRFLASVDENLKSSGKLEKKIDELIHGVFHGYLMGQVFLYDFDNELNQNPEKVLQTKAYHSLLAVRQYVDHFEHEMNDLYVQLVMVTALPQYDQDQKEYAQKALDKMGSFFSGVISDEETLPENLRPLVLSNLREKQTELSEILTALKNDSSISKTDDIKKVFHLNSVYLRATRFQYHKVLKKYKVDKDVLMASIAHEKKKKSYKQLEKEIQALSEKMKEFTSQLDRGTSSDSIYPSAGANGNISGSNFPNNTWSLTYDDGPGTPTSEILKNLKERNMKATFFMLAQQVEKYPTIAASIKKDGHDLASHSYTHAQLTKVEPPQLEREIGTAKKVIEEKLMTKIQLFRLPYGAGTRVSSVRAKIAEHQMIHVFWTVDTLDWQDKNPDSIFERTVKQMKASDKNSGIILFHDIHQRTVSASTRVMEYLNQNNLTACTVQGVVNQINKNLASCK